MAEAKFSSSESVSRGRFLVPLSSTGPADFLIALARETGLVVGFFLTPRRPEAWEEGMTGGSAEIPCFF